MSANPIACRTKSMMPVMPVSDLFSMVILKEESKQKFIKISFRPLIDETNLFFVALTTISALEWQVENKFVPEVLLLDDCLVEHMTRKQTDDMFSSTILSIDYMDDKFDNAL